MKECVRGAFRALAWTRMIFSNVKDMIQLEKVFGEIDQAKDNIKTKAAKDFTTDIQAELKLQDQ